MLRRRLVVEDEEGEGHVLTASDGCVKIACTMRHRKRMDNKLVPAIPTHPGDILHDEIAARHLSQRAVADITGRPYQVINGIINGKKGISAETALDLEKVFPEIPAEFWLRVDLSYRLNMVRLERMQKKAG